MDFRDRFLEIFSETYFLTNSTMEDLNGVKNFYVILAINFAISPVIQVPFLFDFVISKTEVICRLL